MPATVVVGAQWGDEGKGKIANLLAQEADVVVRYQGGNNAGHTIVIGDETFALSPDPERRHLPHRHPGDRQRMRGRPAGCCSPRWTPCGPGASTPTTCGSRPTPI